jgi:hypothetical protein
MGLGPGQALTVNASLDWLRRAGSMVPVRDEEVGASSIGSAQSISFKRVLSADNRASLIRYRSNIECIQVTTKS